MSARKHIVLILTAMVVLHARLLDLPFFWDEAGYYIPAARDFMERGTVVPFSTLHTAHTPLHSIYLAALWKLGGYGIALTRLGMLAIAAFGLWQVFRLAENVSNRQVAIAATWLTMLYPIVFAQSTLAHSDLLATAFLCWGLREYFALTPNLSRTALAFTLAVAAKEIALVVPLALAFCEILLKRASGIRGTTIIALPPVALVVAWFLYFRVTTGAWFGDTSYYSYNVADTLTAPRILFAFIQRLWQTFGHMSMWALALALIAAMLLRPKPDRDRIAIHIQLTFAAVILATLLFHSIVGGALLTRYLLVVYPLVIIVAVSTLWRRAPGWQWVTAAIAALFALSSYVNPPYRFAPEDNLNYADFVRIHQRAATQLENLGRQRAILTAWPASDELTKPELGYVRQPLNVSTMRNFTAEEVFAARALPFDLAFVFSTKYEPPRPLFESRWWLDVSRRYFDYHRDLPPEAIAEFLGGRVVWREERNGQWAAIIVRESVENAALLAP